MTPKPWARSFPSGVSFPSAEGSLKARLAPLRPVSYASFRRELDLRAVKRAGSVNPPHVDSRGFQRPNRFRM
jgi:hypothetical protein